MVVGVAAFPAIQWHAAYAEGEPRWGIGAALIALALTAAWLVIASLIQRIHDFGRSAWWLVTLLVPVLNLLVVFALVAVPGQARSNPYGAPVRHNSVLMWLIFFIVVLLPIGLIPAAVIYVDIHFSR